MHEPEKELTVSRLIAKLSRPELANKTVEVAGLGYITGVAVSEEDPSVVLILDEAVPPDESWRLL